MYGMVLGGAWLLSVSGTAIEVLHHPSETFEFDSVVKLVQQYGNASQQKLAEQYACTPDDTLKRQLIAVYRDTWCKVRAWGVFQEAVTFRIASVTYQWYPAITAFLRANPRFRESKITVEPEQAREKRAYIDAVPYDVILNPANRERFQKALTSGTDFR